MCERFIKFEQFLFIEISKSVPRKIFIRKRAQMLAVQFGVLNIPTLVFLKGGQEVDRVVGVQPKSQLESKIQKLTE